MLYAFSIVLLRLSASSFVLKHNFGIHDKMDEKQETIQVVYAKHRHLVTLVRSWMRRSPTVGDVMFYELSDWPSADQ